MLFTIDAQYVHFFISLLSRIRSGICGDDAMLAPDFAPIAAKSEDIATRLALNTLQHVDVAHPFELEMRLAFVLPEYILSCLRCLVVPTKLFGDARGP